MGREASIQQLRRDDYVFALMPVAGSGMTVLRPGGYDLLVIPGYVAREDALHIHRSYLEGLSRSGQPRTGSAGVMVKEYSSHPNRSRYGRDGWTIAMPGAGFLRQIELSRSSAD
jgi:hypothetical protein